MIPDHDKGSHGLRGRRRDNGRFVWEYEDVTALVIALRYMIHKGYTVKQAKELLAQLEHDKNYEDF